MISHGSSAAQANIAHHPVGNITYLSLGFGNALLQLFATHLQQLPHCRQLDPTPVTFEQPGT
ncbi:hypothetical protein D3C84_634880 [compost metagenome]